MSNSSIKWLSCSVNMSMVVMFNNMPTNIPFTQLMNMFRFQIHILKQVSPMRGTNSHFTAIVDRGRKDRFCFLVMQMVGKSLEDLQDMMPKKVSVCEALEVVKRKSYVVMFGILKKVIGIFEFCLFWKLQNFLF